MMMMMMMKEEEEDRKKKKKKKKKIAISTDGMFSNTGTLLSNCSNSRNVDSPKRNLPMLLEFRIEPNLLLSDQHPSHYHCTQS
jgi:hypothetical protein